MAMRWWKEFWNPQIKCERVGHNDRTHNIVIRKEAPPENYRIVAIDYRATRLQCRRCGRKTEPVCYGEINSWNSVTMPQEMWDAIRDNGYVTMREE